MARRVFYSFHYKPDNWRVGQVRNIGSVEGNAAASDNDWESITGGGDAAIEKWINDQMSGRSCAIVLIGSATANRKWVNHEIAKAWNDGKGVFGIYIHNLEDSNGNQSSKGSDPFAKLTIGGESMSKHTKTYDPPFKTGTYVYSHIADNLEDWIEQAIKDRG